MKKIITQFGNISVYFYNTQKSNKTILFLHGNSCNSNTFQKQFESKDLEDYQLVAIDLLGHGQSDFAIYPETAYTVSSIIETFIEVIEKLELSEYILCAHSFGGHIAIQALSQLKNCKGLMLFSTPPISNLASFAEAFLPNPAFSTLMQPYPSTNEIAVLVNEFTSNANIQYFLKESIIKTETNFRKILAQNIPLHFTSESYVEETHILENISIPICIVHGENEKIVNHHYISKLNIPTLFDKKIHLIENTSHFPQMENASAFNAKLLAFAKYCFDHENSTPLNNVHNDLAQKYLHFYRQTENADNREQKMVEINTMLDTALQYSPSAFFIINYQKMKFEYFSPRLKQIIGNDWTNYLNEGPKYTLSKMLPSHTEIFVNKVLPEIKKQLSKIPMKERINYLFSYNFISVCNSKVFNFMQENRYVHSMPDGTPLMAFANGIDVTGTIPDNLIKLSVHQILENQYELVFEKVFVVEKKMQETYTEQEKKLISLFKKGLDSNHIAKAMNLSVETVKKQM